MNAGLLHLSIVAFLPPVPYADISTGNNLKLRPIYNVAHMVNGNSQINEEWVNEANAIEVDLAFTNEGYPDKFYHGFPCDCGRKCSYSNDIVTHFDTIRRKALQDSTLGLLWIDLKLGNVNDHNLSGEQVAIEMTKAGSLFPPGAVVPSIKVLLGVEKLNQKQFFSGFRKYIEKNRPELLPKFGYDFSSERSLGIDTILAAFQEVGIQENIWMGDGITNCLPLDNTRLIEILKKRDSSTKLAPLKVYAWTSDRTSTMREWLQLGIDAIITNYPNRLKTLVNEEFQNRLALADSNTNPWERIKASEAVPPLARGCSKYILQKYCWMYTTPSYWCWSSTQCDSNNDCYGNLQCS